MHTLIKKPLIKVLVLLLASSTHTGCSNNKQIAVDTEETADINFSYDSVNEDDTTSSLDSERPKRQIEISKYEPKEDKVFERNLFYDGIILATDIDDFWYLVGKDGKHS